MKLIAKKPCSFGGRKFYIGDEIPAELVLKPRDQEKLGVLHVLCGEGECECACSAAGDAIRVTAGGRNLDMTADGLQAVVTALTANAADAVSVVENMTDGDAIILLHMADARKAVKAAAEARGKALEEAVGGHDA